MLTLKCIGSGSDGNCYLLYSGDDVLIVDCGLSMAEIKRGLDYKMMGIKGVVCTHSHADHQKSVKDFRKMHIPVFTPYEQAEKKPQKAQFGTFKVTALPLLDKDMERWQHTNGDGSECPCYAFLIEVDCQRILYVTDTKLLVWNLSKWNIDHLLIGLNYIPENLVRDDFKTVHVLNGHLSLPSAIEIVKANAPQSVILCHLSHGNADKVKCIEEVQKVAKNAFIDVADKGNEWKLYGHNECPF